MTEVFICDRDTSHRVCASVLVRRVLCGVLCEKKQTKKSRPLLYIFFSLYIVSLSLSARTVLELSAGGVTGVSHSCVCARVTRGCGACWRQAGTVRCVSFFVC